MKTKFKFLIFLSILSLLFVLGDIKIYAQDLPNTNLNYFQKGQAVKDVQIALKKIGYNIVTDGIYGPATRASILNFQQKYSNLANDGIYGPNTRAVMIIALKDGDNASTNNPVPKATSTKIQTRGLIFDIGKSSDQIRLLKDFFRARKTTDVSLGYIYDNRTKQLVREYQKSKALQVDGIAGKFTLAKMNKEISDKNYKIRLKVPYINTRTDIIIINKSSNTLYFMKNRVIQEAFPVATGKTTALTPNGQFKVVVKFNSN